MNFKTRYFKIAGDPNEQISRVGLFVVLCKEHGVTPDNLDYFKTYAVLAATGMTDALDLVVKNIGQTVHDNMEEVQLGSTFWSAHFQITREINVAFRNSTNPSKEAYAEVAGIVEQKLNTKLLPLEQEGIFKTLANSRTLMATRVLLKRDLHVDDNGFFIHHGKKFEISVYSSP